MLARNNFLKLLTRNSVANYNDILFFCKVISRSCCKRMNISLGLQWPLFFLMNFDCILYQPGYDHCGKHPHSGGLFKEE